MLDIITNETFINIFLGLLFSCNIFAQNVFSVDYLNKADLKVFVVKYQNQADLKVFKVKYKTSQLVMMESGFLQNTLTKRRKKIYFVKYANQADLKIYFVDYSNQSGWNNNKKKHLLY